MRHLIYTQTCDAIISRLLLLISHLVNHGSFFFSVVCFALTHISWVVLACSLANLSSSSRFGGLLTKTFVFSLSCPSRIQIRALCKPVSNVHFGLQEVALHQELFGSLTCLKTKWWPRPSASFAADCLRFSSRFFTDSSFFMTLHTLMRIPARDTLRHPHSMIRTLLCFSVGMVCLSFLSPNISSISPKSSIFISSDQMTNFQYL